MTSGRLIGARVAPPVSRAKPAGAEASPAAARAEAAPTAPLALILFFVALPALFSFYLAGVRLSPIRLYLLISFAPTLLALFTGRAGRVLLADGVMAGFGLWIIVSLLVDDGMSQLPNSVMTAIELYGGYLLGRVLVRGPADFRLMIAAYLGVMLVLMPFAMTEFLTGRLVLHEIFSHLGETVWKPESSYDRGGFARTMSGFEHPILYGLFCSSLAATVFYVYRGLGQVLRVGLVMMMTLFSLSSAPLLSLGIQISLVLWDKLTRGRWLWLILLAALGYLAIDLVSNRTPLVIIISYLTFDPWTAWTRIAQWDYSTVAVMDHPFFGVGMSNAWQEIYKPRWLTDSVDSFWLVIAVRHGLVGLLLVAGGIVLLLVNVARARLTDPLLRDYRTGWMIGVVGLSFVLITVHIWGAAGIFAFFFLGAGAWLTDAEGRRGRDRGPQGSVAGPQGAGPVRPARPADPDPASPGRPSVPQLQTTRFAQDRVRGAGGAAGAAATENVPESAAPDPAPDPDPAARPGRPGEAPFTRMPPGAPPRTAAGRSDAPFSRTPPDPAPPSRPRAPGKEPS
jgi:hypothetical protein